MVPRSKLSTRSIKHVASQKKAIFEYWGHAAAYLPMDAYRFSLPQKKFFRQGKDNWPKSDANLMREVLERIGQEGPLMARDFVRTENKKGAGWWDWKPAKLALERLFFQGDLMVVERRGFQKVYDLPENILPSHVSTNYPSDQEFAHYLIEDALTKHGIVTIAEICYLRRGVKEIVKQVLADMLASEEILLLNIKGVPEDYYALGNVRDHIPRIHKKLRILSPFDPLVIQRKRLAAIFDFEYQIECYVPKPKRKFGYFTLPLLYGHEFIGRMDAKADRKSSTLHLLKVHLEEGVSSDLLVEDHWKTEILGFARFNNCTKIKVHDVRPTQLLSLLKRLEREVTNSPDA